jgi:hypothetical protein
VSIVGHPSYDAQSGRIMCPLCRCHDVRDTTFKNEERFERHLAKHKPGRDVAEACLTPEGYSRVMRRIRRG